MKTAFVLFSVLLAAVEAGNVCLAGDYKASKIRINHPVVFAAGSPCDGSRSTTYDGINVNNICNQLPFGVRICGQNANMVRTSSGPTSAFGCQIGLEINGRVYTGDAYAHNPDDGNAHKGPCDASCGLTGIDGFMQFVGVPMC